MLGRRGVERPDVEPGDLRLLGQHRALEGLGELVLPGVEPHVVDRHADPAGDEVEERHGRPVRAGAHSGCGRRLGLARHEDAEDLAPARHRADHDGGLVGVLVGEVARLLTLVARDAVRREAHPGAHGGREPARHGADGVVGAQLEADGTTDEPVEEIAERVDEGRGGLGQRCAGAR